MIKKMLFFLALISLPLFAAPSSIQDCESYLAKAQQVEGTIPLYGLNGVKEVPLKKITIYSSDHYRICGIDGKKNVVIETTFIGESHRPSSLNESILEPFFALPKSQIPLKEDWCKVEGKEWIKGLKAPKSRSQNRQSKACNPIYQEIYYTNGILKISTLQYVNWNIWCCELTEREQKLIKSTIEIKTSPTFMEIEELSFQFEEAKTKKIGSGWIFDKPKVVAHGKGQEFTIDTKERET
jgi:hypothetical protein